MIRQPPGAPLQVSIVVKCSAAGWQRYTSTSTLLKGRRGVGEEDKYGFFIIPIIPLDLTRKKKPRHRR